MIIVLIVILYHSYIDILLIKIKIMYKIIFKFITTNYNG